MKQIKTIDIKGYEWFDRINGNSYFSADVTINYGTPDAVSFIIPFQYGYGSQYEHEAAKQIKELYNMADGVSLRDIAVVRSNKITGCLKRQLFGGLKSDKAIYPVTFIN